MEGTNRPRKGKRPEEPPNSRLMGEGATRQLPQDIEAEKAILGAILVNNELLTTLVDMLEDADFYLPQHQKIYGQMIHLFRRQEPIDVLTLKDALDTLGLPEPVSLSYLATLSDGFPRLGNVSQYAEIVRRKSLLRKLIQASFQIVDMSYSETEDIQDIVRQAETAIFDISQSSVKKNYIPFSDALMEAYQYLSQVYQNRDQLTGITTGLERLDALTCGMQRGDLIILAARPSMGKTTLALNIAANAALRGGASVAVFSLEMPARQLALRMIASEGMMDGVKIRSGFLSRDDWARIGETVARLDKAKIFIDETSSLSIMEMESKVKRIKREHGLDLIIVDYLQLMNAGRHMDNRVQEIAIISRSLKAMAKDLDCPVMALSQLSRAPEARKGDHRPMLADLRESGSIEQDADVVAFIYRDEVYNRDDPEVQGKAEVIIAKQRNGPTETVELAYLKQFSRFDNLAYGVEAPAGYQDYQDDYSM